MAIVWNAAPRKADHYWSVVFLLNGQFGDETTYADGYTNGDGPSLADWQVHFACAHSYVAGLMYVDSEDLESVSAVRQVICEKCDHKYGRPETMVRVIEWESVEIPAEVKNRRHAFKGV